MNFYRIISFFILAILCFQNINAQSIKQELNCFSMLVGKEASADGSVFLAHNEDDWGDLYVDWHKVPRMKHKQGEKIRLEKGGTVEQVDETNAFLWLQMPGMQFSDSYLNEYGVAIASNQCRSREDKAVLTDVGSILLSPDSKKYEKSYNAVWKEIEPFPSCGTRAVGPAR